MKELILNFKNKYKFDGYFYLILFIFLFGCVLRFLAFYNHTYDIYGDECHSVASAIRPVSAIFTQFSEGWEFLPGYACILKCIYKIFGFNWAAFRSFGLITSCLSILAFNGVLNKLFENKVIKASCLFLYAISNGLIFYAQAIKPYSYDVLISCILLNIFLSLNKEKINLTWKNTLLLSILFIIMIYSSISAIALVIGFLTIFLIKYGIKKEIKNFFKILSIQIPVVIFTVIEYFTYIIQIQNEKHLYQQWFLDNVFYFKPDSLKAISSIINNFLFEFRMHDYGVVERPDLPNLVVITVIIFFIIGNILFFLPVLKKEKLVNLIEFLLITSPVYVFIALSFMGIYPFCNRAILFLIPFIYVIFIKAFEIIHKKVIGIICICLIISCLICSNKSEIGMELITNNENSKINQETLKQFKEIQNNPDYIILSTEDLCVYCIDNNVRYIILEEIYNSLLSKNTEIPYKYSYRDKHSGEIVKNIDFDQLTNNKRNIYFIYDTNFNEQELIKNFINENMLKHGYKVVKQEEESNFNRYILYEKL